ncbi:MAG: phosphoribosylamine--glycine ligase [Flavobacteriales bacterium]
MNVLILGSGGREHAIGWKIAKSSILNLLYFAPGNPGTAQHGNNIIIDPTDKKAVSNVVKENEIDLVIIGSEKPIVEGLHNFLTNEEQLGVSVIGPKKEAAQLEGSKAFAKAFMNRHDIPTASYKEFNQNNIEEAYSYLEEMNAPYVIKADGLADGKGVIILDELDEAKNTVKDIIQNKKFNKAGEKVVIEEYLEGMEFSVFIVTDGESYKVLPIAKDYKRVGEGDTGLNTGGMGAVSPVPFVDEDLMLKVENKIIKPTLEGLATEALPYQGFLFLGLTNVDTEPYLIEYNVRLGDPEAEVILPRLNTDFMDLLEGIATKTLSERDIKLDDRSAATVVLASQGYPKEYEKGKTITGIEDIEKGLVFHAGTKEFDEDKLVTDGGRVFALTSYGKDIEDALEKVNNNAKTIEFGGKYYRKDIGYDLIKDKMV